MTLCRMEIANKFPHVTLAALKCMSTWMLSGSDKMLAHLVRFGGLLYLVKLCLSYTPLQSRSPSPPPLVVVTEEVVHDLDVALRCPQKQAGGEVVATDRDIRRAAAVVRAPCDPGSM